MTTPPVAATHPPGISRRSSSIVTSSSALRTHRSARPPARPPARPACGPASVRVWLVLALDISGSNGLGRAAFRVGIQVRVQGRVQGCVPGRGCFGTGLSWDGLFWDGTVLGRGCSGMGRDGARGDSGSISKPGFKAGATQGEKPGQSSSRPVHYCRPTITGAGCDKRRPALA